MGLGDTVRGGGRGGGTTMGRSFQEEGSREEGTLRAGAWGSHPGPPGRRTPSVLWPA